MWVRTRTGATTWLPVTTALQHLPEKGHIPPILWMIRCHQGVAYAIIDSGESSSVVWDSRACRTEPHDDAARVPAWKSSLKRR